MNNLDKIMEKLRKLKAMQERGTEGEAQNAAALIQKLLLEHNLSMDNIDSNEKDKSVTIENIHLTGRVGWKTILISGLCEGYMCRFIFKNNTGIVVGEPHNVIVVKEMFIHLESTILRLAHAGYTSQYSCSEAIYKNSYSIGCAGRLRQRLNEELAKAQSTMNNCTALVLNNNHKIERKLEQEGIKFRNCTKHRQISSRDAFERGCSEADKISLNKQLRDASGNSTRKMELQ